MIRSWAIWITNKHGQDGRWFRHAGSSAPFVTNEEPLARAMISAQKNKAVYTMVPTSRCRSCASDIPPGCADYPFCLGGRLKR